MADIILKSTIFPLWDKKKKKKTSQFWMIDLEKMGTPSLKLIITGIRQSQTTGLRQI